MLLPRDLSYLPALSTHGPSWRAGALLHCQPRPLLDSPPTVSQGQKGGSTDSAFLSLLPDSHGAQHRSLRSSRNSHGSFRYCESEAISHLWCALHRWAESPSGGWGLGKLESQELGPGESLHIGVRAGLRSRQVYLPNLLYLHAVWPRAVLADELTVHPSLPHPSSKHLSCLLCPFPTPSLLLGFWAFQPQLANFHHSLLCDPTKALPLHTSPSSHPGSSASFPSQHPQELGTCPSRPSERTNLVSSTMVLLSEADRFRSEPL